MIKVEHLTKYYGDFLAVDDLSFEIDEGHVYGFLGPNGAGKSTTMNIMTGCLSATSGTVRISGYDIYEQPKEAKRRIGYLPEQPPLYLGETPAEYLRFVGEAKGLRGDALRREIEDAIEETGIGEMRSRRIDALSKGYRQRVGIAQALLGSPKVIILDEPTVGLDPLQIIEIRDLIKELGRTHTVIFSSHILSEVQTICDQILIIAKGKLVAFGGPVLEESEPKYMNSQETPVYSKRRVLYGLNLAKKSKRPNIILCEGNIDVVTLHQAGFDNAVASMGTALTVEQTRLLSRFTKELVLCYDNDNAGKIATDRALEILNNSEFSVKVLQLPRRRTEDGELVKQDADDFIKFQGKDAFEALLSGSENGIEFRMAQVAGKYDLTNDEARVAYCGEISGLLAALDNPVEREIYTTRAAETAKITPEAMKLEVQRALRRRTGREKRQELRRDLNPAAQLQPKERELRYDNIRSARAEEGILRLLIRDESLFPEEPPLREEQFSSPLLGRAFTVLWQAKAAGRVPSLAAQAEFFSQEEMNHLTGVCQQPESLSNGRQALADYIRIVQTEAEKRLGGGEADPLLAATEKYKDKKGTGGKQHGK